jgi:hypothetical protein
LGFNNEEGKSWAHYQTIVCQQIEKENFQLSVVIYYRRRDSMKHCRRNLLLYNCLPSKLKRKAISNIQDEDPNYPFLLWQVGRRKFCCISTEAAKNMDGLRQHDAVTKMCSTSTERSFFIDSCNTTVWIVDNRGEVMAQCMCAALLQNASSTPLKEQLLHHHCQGP